MEDVRAYFCGHDQWAFLEIVGGVEGGIDYLSSPREKWLGAYHLAGRPRCEQQEVCVVPVRVWTSRCRGSNSLTSVESSLPAGPTGPIRWAMSMWPKRFAVPTSTSRRATRSPRARSRFGGWFDAHGSHRRRLRRGCDTSRRPNGAVGEPRSPPTIA